MRKLLTGYAVNFNRRHKRYGHLFQNRYKSIVCQEDNYLLELVRYIHLNLLRVGIVKNLSELNRSPWTGHSALVGKKKKGWQDTEYILSFFGNGPKGMKKYLEFIQEGIPLGRRPELVGGGLIRSLGGWSAVLALRGRIERQIVDARILGDLKSLLLVHNSASSFFQYGEVKSKDRTKCQTENFFDVLTKTAMF